VIAYEPNPQLAARLNSLFPDVHVRNVALSDHVSQVTLQVPISNGREQHELASISQSFGGETRVHVVRAVTLDSEQLTNVGFLKIDVEQHERAVLRGALKTITKWRPAIMTEITPLLYEKRLDTTFSFLTDLGYRGWFGFSKRYLPLEDFDPSVHANPANFGAPKGFMRNNMFFFPQEDPLARNGPRTSRS
jgi:FkbM family methyltransferase